MFPFDHADHPDPNSSAAHAEVWLQQCKSSWRESELVADKANALSDVSSACWACRMHACLRGMCCACMHARLPARDVLRMHACMRACGDALHALVEQRL
jgi:hypothetical protein